MGLVQLFREVPCPDLMARCLLELALVDFRETGRHYLLHLVLSHRTARRIGTTQEVEALDEQIDRYQGQQQLPARLTFLFSEAGYARYGDALLPLWASALIEICGLEQHWEGERQVRRQEMRMLAVLRLARRLQRHDFPGRVVT